MGLLATTKIQNAPDAKSTLIWITDILKTLHIPFQIAGGLAAIAYGSTRELHDIDIDIPEDKFDVVHHAIKEFIIYGPERHKSEKWDLALITLNYKNQLIDLSGAYDTKIWDAKIGEWHHLITDFSNVEIKSVLGLQLPVIAFDELLSYKRILAREVDLRDIAELEILER